MVMGVLLHWTQANSFELVVHQSHGRPQGRSLPLKPRRLLPLNPLFYHRNVVKYTSSKSGEPVMRLN